jgi:hypothetical protein
MSSAEKKSELADVSAKKVSRRTFVKGGAIAGGALVLGAVYSSPNMKSVSASPVPVTTPTTQSCVLAAVIDCHYDEAKDEATVVYRICNCINDHAISNVEFSIPDDVDASAIADSSCGTWGNIEDEDEDKIKFEEPPVELKFEDCCELTVVYQGEVDFTQTIKVKAATETMSIDVKVKCGD